MDDPVNATKKSLSGLHPDNARGFIPEHIKHWIVKEFPQLDPFSRHNFYATLDGCQEGLNYLEKNIAEKYQEWKRLRSEADDYKEDLKHDLLQEIEDFRKTLDVFREDHEKEADKFKEYMARWPTQEKYKNAKDLEKRLQWIEDNLKEIENMTLWQRIKFAFGSRK